VADVHKELHGTDRHGAKLHGASLFLIPNKVGLKGLQLTTFLRLA
jgi:hypothetical protein